MEPRKEKKNHGSSPSLLNLKRSQKETNGFLVGVVVVRISKRIANFERKRKLNVKAKVIVIMVKEVAKTSKLIYENNEPSLKLHSKFHCYCLLNFCCA